MTAAAVLMAALMAAGPIDYLADLHEQDLEAVLAEGAGGADERAAARGVPVVNRLDDDGTYFTWSLILRHENGLATLAYESGGNGAHLKAAHAAVESARLLNRPVSVDGLRGSQGVILLEHIEVNRQTFATDEDDPLEDAILEAEAIEAVHPQVDIGAVPTPIAELDRRHGQTVKVTGRPVANAFKHHNGQGIWNVLLSDGAATVLAYESGENIDQLSRLAALVDLAVAEKRQVSLFGAYDAEQQVLELAAMETDRGVRYLTDLGEVGAAAGDVDRGEPRVLRAVEPLRLDDLAVPGYSALDWAAIEDEYLTPTYVETPVPVVVEREVVIEHHHYWVFPEIVVVVRGRGWRDGLPRWLRGWGAWAFCPRDTFDSRWHDWHVRRHPAYFNFSFCFTWHRDRDEDRRDRGTGDRDEPRRAGRRQPARTPHRSRREEVARRALAFAEARRGALQRDRSSDRDRRPPERPPQRTLPAARTPPPTQPDRTPRMQPRSPLPTAPRTDARTAAEERRQETLEEHRRQVNDALRRHQELIRQHLTERSAEPTRRTTSGVRPPTTPRVPATTPRPPVMRPSPPARRIDTDSAAERARREALDQQRRRLEEIRSRREAALRPRPTSTREQPTRRTTSDVAQPTRPRVPATTPRPAVVRPSPPTRRTNADSAAERARREALDQQRRRLEAIRSRREAARPTPARATDDRRATRSEPPARTRRSSPPAAKPSRSPAPRPSPSASDARRRDLEERRREAAKAAEKPARKKR